MQSYRVVPVGDKLVLLMEPRLSQPVGEGQEYADVRGVDSGCYDFGSERASESEGFSQVSISSGGPSHE